MVLSILVKLGFKADNIAYVTFCNVKYRRPNPHHNFFLLICKQLSFIDHIIYNV